MARSRPPTLRTLSHRLVRDERLLGRGDRVLCACSGGPDSIALLHVLSLLRKTIGHEIVAVGVDHGLRGEAVKELALAASLAEQHGIPFEIASVSVNPGAGLQARAREHRHRALQDAAQRNGATLIALGHTADDRAETVLMRLLRGAGPRGLAAMPARSPAIDEGVDLVRPLLTGRRSDVLAHVRRHALSCAEDPSNRDRRYLRVRVRTEVLPLLEELSPTVVRHLCALADALEHDRGSDSLAGLGRSQRHQIRRLLRRGAGRTTVRVSGGKDLTLAFFSAPPVILDEQ